MEYFDKEEKLGLFPALILVAIIGLAGALLGSVYDFSTPAPTECDCSPCRCDDD